MTGDKLTPCPVCGTPGRIISANGGTTHFEAAGLNVERIMDAQHRWCIQVGGNFALHHQVDDHRDQAEFLVARLKEAPP